VRFVTVLHRLSCTGARQPLVFMSTVDRPSCLKRASTMRASVSRRRHRYQSLIWSMLAQPLHGWRLLSQLMRSKHRQVKLDFPEHVLHLLVRKLQAVLLLQEASQNACGSIGAHYRKYIHRCGKGTAWNRRQYFGKREALTMARLLHLDTDRLRSCYLEQRTHHHLMYNEALACICPDATTTKSSRTRMLAKQHTLSWGKSAITRIS
jgi:hypothetical protein